MRRLRIVKRDESFSLIFFLPEREYIGEGSRSVELRGAHEGGGAPTPWARPPASWPPRRVPDFNSKSSGLLSVEERSLRRFHSVWTPFGIPFLQNSKIGKKAETDTGPSVNSLVPGII